MLRGKTGVSEEGLHCEMAFERDHRTKAQHLLISDVSVDAAFLDAR